MNVYDEKYLNNAMENLGEAFDYAVNTCGLSLNEFMELFLASGYADNFEIGNPKIIAGYSGMELAIEVITKSGMQMSFPETNVSFDCSPEYWCGWILAFYQWTTGRTFRDIYSKISMNDIYKLYSTHHEASEEKFKDTVNAMILRKKRADKAPAATKNLRIFSETACRKIRH